MIYRQQTGFTLIELMIVLVMVAILLGVGVPSFFSTIERNRMASTLQSTLTNLAYARTEAVVRGVPVSMCPSADQSTCSGGAFEIGYLVFADDGAGAGGLAGDGIRNGAEEIIRIDEGAPGAVVVRAQNFPSTTSLTFLRTGELRAFQPGTLVLCDERGDEDARSVVVNASGMMRLGVDANDDGVLEDDLGSAVSCATA